MKFKSDRDSIVLAVVLDIISILFFCWLMFKLDFDIFSILAFLFIFLRAVFFNTFFYNEIEIYDNVLFIKNKYFKSLNWEVSLMEPNLSITLVGSTYISRTGNTSIVLEIKRNSYQIVSKKYVLLYYTQNKLLTVFHYLKEKYPEINTQIRN